MAILSDLEKDGLTELFNIGLGSAIDILSGMVNQEIHFQIPQIDETQSFKVLSFSQSQEPICMVLQEFSGEMGKISAMVALEFENCKDISELLLNEPILDDEIGEFEKGALLELGNVLLNSSLGSFASLLQKSISSTMPKIFVGQKEKLFSRFEDKKFTSVRLDIQFVINDKSMEIGIFFLFQEQSIYLVQKSLQEYIQKI